MGVDMVAYRGHFSRRVEAPALIACLSLVSHVANWTSAYHYAKVKRAFTPEDLFQCCLQRGLVDIACLLQT